MVWLPSLEYNLSHPYPRSQWFLLATIILFLTVFPVLILVNFATQGSELVPSLQTSFQPNETLLAGWWGTGRLPDVWRPRAPECQPKDFGRGDILRLSPSLFDYTVQSAWRTSGGLSAGEVRRQERVEYRGESFAGCLLNTTRFDYNFVEQTQTVRVPVICPGTPDYPVRVAMQTAPVFSADADKDSMTFGVQYIPSWEQMNTTGAGPSDYRRIVMAVLGLISTDSVAIIGGQHLPDPVLGMSLVLVMNPDTASTGLLTTTSITYANGTRGPLPAAANIYLPSIWNLMNVVMAAVMIDLGSHQYQNLFRNPTVFQQVLGPNLPPAGIPSDSWANTSDIKSFSFGKIPPPYQTWAQALLAGQPVPVGASLTGLPRDSAMATTYLCPAYRVKPMSALLSSVFVGAATMILSVWSAWIVFTTFLAKEIMAPRVQCNCAECQARESKETRQAPDRVGTGLLGGFRFWQRAKPAQPVPSPKDVELSERLLPNP